MSPTTPFYNLLFLGLLIFGVLLFFLGLFGKMGAISILKKENSTTSVLMGIGGALLCAAVVVWGANDVLQGPQKSQIVKWVSTTMDSMLHTSMNPWQTKP